MDGDGGGRLYFVNPITVDQDAIDLGAPGSAQYEFAGAVINTIPREGGNKFGGTFSGSWTGPSLAADNLTPELVKRLNDQGYDVIGSTPEAHEAETRRLVTFWVELGKRVPIAAD